MIDNKYTIDFNKPALENVLDLIQKSNPSLFGLGTKDFIVVGYGDNPIPDEKEGNSYIRIKGLHSRGFSGETTFYYDRIDLSQWQLPEITGTFETRHQTALDGTWTKDWFTKVSETEQGRDWSKRMIQNLPTLDAPNGLNVGTALGYKKEFLNHLGLHQELACYTPTANQETLYDYIYRIQAENPWMMNNEIYFAGLRSNTEENITYDPNKPWVNEVPYIGSESWDNDINSEELTRYRNINHNTQTYAHLLYKGEFTYFGTNK